jgi:hypothetical protein
MRSSICLTLLLVGFVFTATSFAQEKEVTKNEYLASWRDAFDKARTLTRRVTQIVTNHESEMPDIDEWRYEYVMPDKSRLTNIRTKDGKVTRIEQIDIGNTKYCKKGDGEWELSEGYCIGGSGMGGPSNIASNRYYLEKKNINGKEIRVFRNYITYTNKFSPTHETEGLTFSETTFWLNRDNLIIREEIRTGLVNKGKARRTNVSSYEYNPKDLKIEAPIK